MRIAVPSDDGRNIAQHFGRAKSFIIFEIENKSVLSSNIKENNPYHNNNHEGDHHSSHAHSHKRFVDLLDGCQAIICRGMGRRAVVDLDAAGIKTVFTDIENAEMAAAAFAAGILVPVESPGCGCD